MTDKQKFKLYFPLWRAACEANGWKMVKGRLESDASRATDWSRKVETFAAQRAAMEHRAPAMDDLRHGAHILALGRDKSSNLLDNRELDRVVTVFKLLADPDDLDALMAWDHPENGEKKRLEWFLGHTAPDAYVRAIAADKFGTRMWEWLELGQMRELARTLSERRRAWNKRVETQRRDRPSPGGYGPARGRREEYVAGPF